MDLAKKTCVPCERGASALSAGEVAKLLREIKGWTATPDNKKIEKRFTFPDFVAAIAFINKMAGVAEAEGHHPDFSVHYNRVDVTLDTHAIGGLSENDFILAAKIDEL
jgi:4a-hydroxytetrahydrobiopterin dehydratase